MYGLDKEQVSIVLALVKQASTRTTDEVKINKLLNIAQKFDVETVPSPRITQEQIQIVTNLLADLEELSAQYSNSQDITSLDLYDILKKQIGSKLESLSTYKDMFATEAMYLEYTCKREYKVIVVRKIMKELNISYTQAEKQVEADPKYVIARDTYFQIKELADIVGTKYRFYTQLLQNINQSVSTANKERNTIKNN